MNQILLLGYGFISGDRQQFDPFVALSFAAVGPVFIEARSATPRNERSSCGYDQIGFTPGPINMAGFTPFLGINFWARPLSTSAV